MKNRVVMLALAAIVVAGPSSIAAQAEDAALPSGIFVDAQSSDQYLAKDHLIGAKVYDKDGKIIGDIEDLVIGEFNQVVGIVMGTGGFMGLGEKKIGVSLKALKFDDKDGKTIVSLPEATKENLAAATAFTRTQPKKTLLERAREKALELRDKTTATTQDAVDAAKPKLEEAKEKAVEAYEKAKEAAQPAIEKAKEAAEEAKEAVKEAVEAAKEATKEVTGEAPAPESPPASEATPAPEPAPAPAPESAPAPAPDTPAQPE